MDDLEIHEMVYNVFGILLPKDCSLVKKIKKKIPPVVWGYCYFRGNQTLMDF